MNIEEERIARFRDIDIYPVISSEFTNGRDVIDVLKAVAAGGAKVVQLREKNKTKKEIYDLAEEYRRITAENNMLLIVNDHTDIALAVGADGVHLGQDDFPLEAALKIAPGLIFGVSSHDRAEAEEAIKAGAGYINIGPLYTTQTKSLPMSALGTELLKELAPKLKIPFTVMGGIKARHIPELITCGAKRIAMVTEITQAEDITARVKELRALILN